MRRRHHQQSIGYEAARVADDQLVGALSDLHPTGSVGVGAVHDARRHIRNVRALLRLLRPHLAKGDYGEADQRLRALQRRLAPMANAPLVLGTLARAASRSEAKEAQPALDAIQKALTQRAERIKRSTASARLLKHAETTLTVERARLGTWEIERRRLPIAGDLEKSRRAAVKAMTRAAARPAPGGDRAWRRSTRRLWLEVRLLEPSRRDLREVRRRLDVLNGTLDESHSVTVLERILVAEPLASRRDTAAALRLLRHYQTRLRARAVQQCQRALQAKRRGHTRTAASSPARTTV